METFMHKNQVIFIIDFGFSKSIINNKNYNRENNCIQSLNGRKEIKSSGKTKFLLR